MRVPQVILTVDRTLRDLLRALSGRLTFVENIQSVIIDVTDSGPAGVELVLNHNLGVRPTGYIANASAGSVNTSNQSLWSGQEIRVKCSASNASIRLVVF